MTISRTTRPGVPPGEQQGGKDGFAQQTSEKNRTRTEQRDFSWTHDACVAARVSLPDITEYHEILLRHLNVVVRGFFILVIGILDHAKLTLEFLQ